MDRQELIDMLNKDLADEHISVIRYLTHAYEEGEDTPLGAMLLSMAREEMWHVDWLGDVLGELGAEPNMIPGVYPYDPLSNATLLRSYIAWEENLVVEYARQAEMVDDPEIKRVLMQQSIESEIHKRRFADMLEKLGEAANEPRHFRDTGEFSPKMIDRLQREMTDEYKLVIQHLRDAFAFEDAPSVSSELELTAMRHMKHMSHFAERLAEVGHMPQFIPPKVTRTAEVKDALENDLALTEQAQARFEALLQEKELAEHSDLQIEVKQIINQEAFLAETLEELIESAESAEEPPQPPDSEPKSGWTVGSLIERD